MSYNQNDNYKFYNYDKLRNKEINPSSNVSEIQINDPLSIEESEEVGSPKNININNQISNNFLLKPNNNLNNEIKKNYKSDNIIKVIPQENKDISNHKRSVDKDKDKEMSPFNFKYNKGAQSNIIIEESNKNTNIEHASKKYNSHDNENNTYLEFNQSNNDKEIEIKRLKHVIEEKDSLIEQLKKNLEDSVLDSDRFKGKHQSKLLKSSTFIDDLKHLSKKETVEEVLSVDLKSKSNIIKNLNIEIEILNKRLNTALNTIDNMRNEVKYRDLKTQGIVEDDDEEPEDSDEEEMKKKQRRERRKKKKAQMKKEIESLKSKLNQAEKDYYEKERLYMDRIIALQTIIEESKEKNTINNNAKGSDIFNNIKIFNEDIYKKPECGEKETDIIRPKINTTGNSSNSNNIKESNNSDINQNESDKNADILNINKYQY